MEAQLVAVDEEGSIKDAYVLDISWRSIKEAFLSPRGREMMANDLIDSRIDRTPMPLDVEMQATLAAYKASMLPNETKWSRTQKVEAVKWMARQWNPSSKWEDFCEEAKRKFKIIPYGALDEYNWFSCCLFLKQLLDFAVRHQDLKCVVAPVAPLENA
jgi:hypothetical protein